MTQIVVINSETVVVEEQLSFTLAALCQATGAGMEQVQGLVDEGVLRPSGQGVDGWRFGGEAMPHARRALRLARDFGLDLAALGLVMDLLAEIDRLRAVRHQP